MLGKKYLPAITSWIFRVSLGGISRCVNIVACLCAAACGTPDAAADNLDVPAWMAQAMSLPVGQMFTVAPDGDAAIHSLHALGYARLEEGVYERRVDLLQTERLVLSHMLELPEIDAVAILSVYRPNLDEQYIYPTLRSLLTELPETAQINILVGNAETAYLQPQVLDAQVAPRASSRIHLMLTPQPVADFFGKEPIRTSPRAAWNYARALRSYVGRSHLMVFEDDITLAKNSLSQLRPWLKEPRTPIFALYNDRCYALSRLWSRSDSALGVGPSTIRKNRDFPTLQAMIYSKTVAAEAGSYVALRAGRETHDYMLGRYFSQTPTVLGYVHPSVAQHWGLQTTGLSGATSLPYSQCYQAEISVR